MLYFFYGEDTYSIKKALSKIGSSFVDKEKSDLNIAKINGENITMGQFSQQIATMPFLGEKRLVFVSNIFKNSNKEIRKNIAETIKKIPEFLTLIFAEDGLPDKRETLYKTLVKIASVKEFAQKSDYELRSWIENWSKVREIKINPAASAKLILYAGNDLWRLENELNKLAGLAYFDKRQEINDSDVEKLVVANNNYKIFDLTDALAEKNTQKAYSALYSFLNEKEEEMKIFNLIISQVRNLLVISSLANLSEREITEKTKLHPYVVKKTLHFSRKFSTGQLKSFYHYLAETDWAIKSGQIDPRNSLDLLVATLCEKC